MNFLLIFLIPLCGIVVAAFLVKLFPKAQFSGYDILPFFFIVACQLLTQETKQPSFLPYGFLLYFILVVIISIYTAIKNKNISVGKTFGMLWHYLAASSIVWYVGLLILLLL